YRSFHDENFLIKTRFFSSYQNPSSGRMPTPKCPFYGHRCSPMVGYLFCANILLSRFLPCFPWHTTSISHQSRASDDLEICNHGRMPSNPCIMGDIGS
ncbi:MAG: hypothetical protein NC548_35315, partial [Lachnospiraceae bacterium]|nr:hypothetical protein [Lachnospiraceae bacterium]